MFSYILSGIMPKVKVGFDEEIKKIGDLKKRLVRLGYHPEEVDYFVAMEMDDRDIRRLSLDQLKKIQVMLSGMVSIGEKALKVGRKAQA